MRNIKLTIEYDGTNYLGWQLQKRSPTIQGEIEKAVFKLTGKHSRLIGAARTDSGVHARAQVANFKTTSKIPLHKVVLGLNRYLPEDIVILDADEETGDFNARFAAKSKRYQYAILLRKVRSPLNALSSYHYPYRLNISLMKREIKNLLGKHDFRCFQAQDKIERSSVRRIKDISLRKRGDLLIFEVEGNGFLYRMVRNIVGTLIEIGRGYFAPGYMKFLLKEKNRKFAGPTAPANALTLLKVTY